MADAVFQFLCEPKQIFMSFLFEFNRLSNENNTHNVEVVGKKACTVQEFSL